MAKQKKPLYDPETGIHRAKLWEIALYALNNSSTNIYMMAFMYVTYFLTGFCGVGVVLAGTITTIMRIWDGVTDPFVGMVVDKTNTKFGKNRPFIIIGNVILFVTSGIIYHVTPNLHPAAAAENRPAAADKAHPPLQRRWGRRCGRRFHTLHGGAIRRGYV